MNGSQRSSKIPVIGVAGWKNSGKTTLVVRLIAEFTRRGLNVGTVKHSHHTVEIDDDETDSARHRRAGARQAALVSPKRWALITEIADQPEPSLDDVIAGFSGCDLIIVEGYKSAEVPKIEVRRLASETRVALADSDPLVIAIAADHPVEGARVPVFGLDDVAGIADHIAYVLGPLSVSSEPHV